MLIRIGLGAMNTLASFLIFQESFELINIRSDWAVLGGMPDDFRYCALFHLVDDGNFSRSQKNECGSLRTEMT